MRHEIWVQSLIWEEPLERKWHSTPIFLLEESHGQRSLMGYSPEGSQRVRHDLSTQTQYTKDLNRHISKAYGEKYIISH